MNRFTCWFLLLLITAGIGLLPFRDASAADAREACAILLKEDVETAFAPRKFDSGTPGFAIKGSKSWAAVSSCTYSSKGATIKDMVTVTLNLRRAQNDATGMTPKAAKAGAVKLKGHPVAVAGLGKGAYWVSFGNKAFPSVQLNVFRGKREWLTFGSSAKTLGSGTILAGLKKLAKATLSRQ